LTVSQQFLGRTHGLALALAIVASGCAGSTAPKVAGAPSPKAVVAAAPRRAGLPNARGLDNFFLDLQRLESGQITRVHIIQLGDSHTAGDVFTGYLRREFQSRFGDAGRGTMPPGLAYPGLRQAEVTVTQSGRWVIHNSRTATDSRPYGISGFILTSGAAGDRMEVSPNDGSTIDSAAVDFVQHDNGGTIAVRFDGQPGGLISTAGPEGQVKHASLIPPEGARSLELVAEKPDIDIADWSIEKNHPGVLVESFGVISATAGIFDHWDPEAVRQKLAVLQPSLIILSYGTNEGFGGDFDSVSYHSGFTGIIRELKRDAPDSAILVVGPPDAKRRESNCPKRKGVRRACGWATPHALAEVREVQRRIAASEGVAFWDWSSVMERGIEPWVRADPPLARADHVHFTVPGYERGAAALYAMLMERYAAFGHDRATAHAKR
jgi:lysophospholipase L1-like esterase